jgi:TolB-like protein
MNKALASIIINTLLLLITVNVHSADRIQLAVLDFSENNVSKILAHAVSEIISVELSKKNDFTVMERSQIGRVLDEQGFQQTGCTDQACAVQMGKLLSANKILIGMLAKVGSVHVITAKLIDVETGKIDFAESERCVNENDIEPASRVLAVRLTNIITGKNYKLPPVTWKTEEERNRFALYLGGGYGIIKGVARPAPKSDGTSVTFPEKKSDGSSIIADIRPSYELTDVFTVRFGYRYIFLKSGESEYPWGPYYSATYDDVTLTGNGFNIGIQTNYRLEGFIPFCAVSAGYNKLTMMSNGKIANIWTTGSNGYSFLPKKSVKYFSTEFELGFAVYLSKYVELVLSGAMYLPIAAKLVTIESTRTTGVPTETLNNNFKGNFPPTFYAQAGVNFRMF